MIENCFAVIDYASALQCDSVVKEGFSDQPKRNLCRLVKFERYLFRALLAILFQCYYRKIKSVHIYVQWNLVITLVVCSFCLKKLKIGVSHPDASELNVCA